MTQTRALILLRLSRMTDETASPERQLRDCERYCAAHDMTVAGVAEDWDVSGSTDPQERSGSGPWLRDRLDEFDVVIASKLDRVGRNANHIHRLMTYLIDAGKSLKCAGDAIDISSPIGRMIVYIMATVAELELTAISERNTSASQILIESGRHRGGTTPAGYRSEQSGAEDARGKATFRLVPDDGPDGLAPVIREVIQRLADGERSSSVIHDLDNRGVPTPRDRQNVIQGRESQNREWRASNFRRLVQSPTLIGLAVHRPIVTDAAGKPVMVNGKKQYGEEQIVFKDGVPQQRAEPIVSSELFYAAQAKIEERTQKQDGSRRADAPAMLTGVAHCGTCGFKLYRNVRTDRRDVYRCNSTQKGKTCGNGTMICSRPALTSR